MVVVKTNHEWRQNELGTKFDPLPTTDTTTPNGLHASQYIYQFSALIGQIVQSKHHVDSDNILKAPPM